MKYTSHLPLLFLTLGLLSACNTAPRRPAPVIDRLPAADNRAPRPAEDAKDERGMYTVRKGDTLIRIALDHGQNYRDLVEWNKLSNPNDIKVDQVLRVLPPDSGASAGAASGGVVTSKIDMPPPSEPKAPPAPVVVKKTTPRADKRPYSDNALAELQKGEGGAPARPEAKPVEKPERDPHPPAVTVIAPPAVTAPPAAASDEEKLSWMWPSDGKIVATFDEGKNKGIDIAGKAGQHVMAAGAGKVMYAGSGIRGYGNLVIVKHSNSLLSAYAHNRSIVVKEGQSVNKGQVIAEMGDSDADSVKLHFEIRQQGKPVDPSRFLPNR
ncbi:peptidoglycan DD-metalloendopeptidase family protein [Massilia atriviolacea]|uniref:LysM peptidoglycan-binding domain-containing protein n=1 Tax=Massilia atriviolacea TaxID=2495579 RepID=A0A430HNE2_9BURK|nr:peptidoglycan DD-metalloendopeptidase family protein [Massilia atriviolacea]RSZ59068.1 LysM peptidoglycan-binding domain-containing protein [Massilia atriviolacea]